MQIHEVANDLESIRSSFRDLVFSNAAIYNILRELIRVLSIVNQTTEIRTQLRKQFNITFVIKKTK